MKTFFLRVINKLLRANLPPARYAVKLKRQYRLRSFGRSDKKVLEICGGILPISRANINVDILDDPMVDVIANLHEKLPFPDNSVDKIVSIATLEHFNLSDMRKVLKEFQRILKRGAVLEVGVPSLEKIFNYYKKYGLDDACLRQLHGAQKDEYDIHLCVLDFVKMKKELEALDYSGIIELKYDYPVQDERFFMKVRAYK
ncbi:MAG: methyltransferase domain-containing protein [Patescibacteria group bacterium]|nr:methyltransferase domain-containing protein [Patescibacteria group bacterium]